MTFPAALITVVLVVGQPVVIHEGDPARPIFSRCEAVSDKDGFPVEVRAYWLSWGKSWDQCREKLAQEAEALGGNVVNVTVLEKVLAKPPKYREKGIVYVCPAEVVMQLTERGGVSE